MEKEEVSLLATEHARKFLAAHAGDDPAAVALKYGNNTELPVRAIAEQLACRKKAIKKLPILSRKQLLYESVALEQCSSEATALYKKNILNGKRLLDCTGGLGIDTIFLSEVFDEVVYCEKNPVLTEIFIMNSRILGVSNVTPYNKNCIELLSAFPDNAFDWIYLDPSRRDAQKRYVGFSRCEPDITKHLDLFNTKASHICIKASPAFEIEEAERLFPGLYTSIVVSVHGECREILFCIDTGEKQDMQSTKAVMLSSSGEVTAQFEQTSGDAPQRMYTESIRKYFYEPDPAIIKSRCSSAVSKEFFLSFINTSVDYVTADRLIIDFPGRIFEVIAVLPWQRRRVKQYCTERNIKQANVARRDFPMNPEEIKKILHLSDGGEDYLFFTQDIQDKPIVIHGRKVTNVSNK